MGLHAYVEEGVGERHDVETNVLLSGRHVALSRVVGMHHNNHLDKLVCDGPDALVVVLHKAQNGLLDLCQLLPQRLSVIKTKEQSTQSGYS